MTKAQELQGLIEAALKAQSAVLYNPPQPKNARAYACKVTSCPNAAYAGGYCNAHYIRARKGKPMDVPLKHRTGGTCRECDKPVDRKGGWALCKSHFNIRRRKIIRQVCVDFFGGRCSACHGEFPLPVYDFHHLDPGEKERHTSDMIGNRSSAALAEEIVKCVLLCANCHRIEHMQ
jgi:hypothetical protein